MEDGIVALFVVLMAVQATGIALGLVILIRALSE